MIEITRILCPVDFSEYSRHAVHHAAALARWYEARLTLLYVFENRPVLELPPMTLADADRQRLLADLRQLSAGVPAGVPVDCVVQEAPAAHAEILAQLTLTRADLLVMGTHGRSGFQQLFLGSITEKVMRTASCPVLVVPRRAADVPADAPVECRRILCAVDFSESSLDALTWAVNLAEESDARLTVLHVVEGLFGADYEVMPATLHDVRATLAADARRQIHRLIPDQARTVCTIDTEIADGRAHREIVRRAGEGRADLIVMGVTGHGALDRALFGSTTHHVVRAAPCPVLLVRSREGRPA
jgi:nucleotide-binding universal stress UspA family protein